MAPSIAMYHEQFNKHQSFVCTQLNDQTVLFLITEFSISQQNQMLPSIGNSSLSSNSI